MNSLLGIPVEKLDTSKYMMQLRGIVHWKRMGGKGTMECCTAFGKTYLACIAIKKMTKTMPKLRAMVIVPTQQLQGQWTTLLTDLELIQYCEVYVVNTIALKEVSYETNLLILDEMHRYASDHFSKVFSLVKYRFVMGLTATIDRLDGREKFLKEYAPVVMRITQKEAIRRGWISDFIECNVPMLLRRDEKEKLSNMSKIISESLNTFNKDPDLMRRCMQIEEAATYARCLWMTASQDVIKDKAKEYQIAALQGQQFTAMRLNFLNNLEQKIVATVDLINEFGLKTITFSQSTQFADEVNNRIGKRAVAYHTKLQPYYRNEKKTKSFKTERGAIQYAIKHKCKYTSMDNEWIAYWTEAKKVGITVQKREALDNFSNNKGGVDVICTARALDQGFNVEDVEIGINASGSSNPTQYVQRSGRVARNYTYKDGTKKQGIFVNLYVPNSRDKSSLDRAQVGSLNVIELDSIEECIALIRKRMKVS
mgnify:CR=1 FL=1